MSGSNLTERELDNIYSSYASYGPERLGDFIRTIWKEAWDEAHDIGYKTGVAEGYNMGRKDRR
jgi:hypothetical protein